MLAKSTTNISNLSPRMQVALSKVIGEVLLDYANRTGTLSDNIIQWLYSLPPGLLEDMIRVAEDYASDIAGAIPVKRCLDKPHIMIVGETGSGKSTLCKYLVSMATAPCIAIDPHATPSDWNGVFVVGGGMNYADVEKAFKVLYDLMKHRYELRDAGQTHFEPLVVIVDEFLAITSNDIYGKACSDYFKKLIREARKVGIKLVILAQGAEVKSLGIEGEGSIRDGLAVVYLGKFAVKQCRKECPQHGRIMQQLEHPCMVDDMPAALPTIPDNLQFPNQQLPADFMALWEAAPQRQNPKKKQLLLKGATGADAVTASLSNTQQASASSDGDPIKSAILSYASKHPNELIQPRDILSGVWVARDIGTERAKQYLEDLANEGYGQLIAQGLVTNS